jgi:hypothetical protein
MGRPLNTGSEPWVDPAEDAASMSSLRLAPAIEIEARKLREAHIGRRMAETEEAASAKIAKWNAGISRPQGGGHRA